MEATTFYYAFLFTASVIYTTILLLCKRRSSPPLPPGPVGLPIVGSLPFLDASSLHTYFADLSTKYGPILSLRLGSKLAVVISSPSLARAVLQEHDNIFANRDPSVGGLLSTYGGNDIVWTPNGPTWRMLRRVCVQAMLSPSSLDAVSALRQQEVQSTVRHIHARSGTPVDIGTEVFVNSLNKLTNTMWGGSLVEDDKRVSIGNNLKELVADTNELWGQPNVSEFLPALARFDLQGVQGKIKSLAERFDKIFESIIEKKLCTDQGERTKDFLDFLLRLEREEGNSKTPFTRTHLKALLMDMFVGGTDTTLAIVEWAMAEILNKPDILQKLHEELNQVVGKDSLVQESHLPQLHFLSLVIKETLRLHPPAPFLIPHCPSCPCTIDGYHIPEGSRIFVNVWKIQTDPSQWTNPMEFRPERFIQKGFQRDFTGNNFDYLPFGSGRRKCVGIAMAERVLGYLLATMVPSFDWKLPEGNKMDLSEKFGHVMKKAVPLVAIPTPRLSKDELYY